MILKLGKKCFILESWIKYLFQTYEKKKKKHDQMKASGIL